MARHWALRGFFCILFIGMLLTSAVGAEEAARLPVPDAASQAASLKLVHDLFKAEYARRTPSGRHDLAEKLLASAAESSGDPVASYVLLHEAIDAAASAEDVTTAMKAAGALGERFNVDAKATKLDAMLALSRNTKSPEGATDLVAAGLELFNAAAIQEDYETVSRLSPLLESAASRTHAASLQSDVRQRIREATLARSAADAAHVAEQTLAKNPDDPDANLALAHFLILHRHDWPRALGYLEKGSDKDLKALAKGDAAAGETPDLRTLTSRGDAWWTYAATQGATMKVQAERRAQEWYSRAIPSTDGLERLKLERRVAQADADAKAFLSKHGGGFEPSAEQVKAQRQRIERQPTTPLDASPITADKTFPTGPDPFTLRGAVIVPAEKAVKIVFLPGTEIRGGVFDLHRAGHISAAGAKGKPIIFRHVTFQQDLSASMEAQDAIFDDCTFRKNGGWFSSYSTKWTFTRCVLFNCKFPPLTEVNFGFKFQNCALVAMDLPEIVHPHKAGFAHPTSFHRDWNKVIGCEFIDCAVPPTFCWCAESSNFRRCKFVPGEAFESPVPWDHTAYITETEGSSPADVWQTHPAAHAPVRLIQAPSPFDTLPLTGVDAAIPELIISPDRGPHLFARPVATVPASSR